MKRPLASTAQAAAQSLPPITTGDTPSPPRAGAAPFLGGGGKASTQSRPPNPGARKTAKKKNLLGKAVSGGPFLRGGKTNPRRQPPQRLLSRRGFAPHRPYRKVAGV